MSHFPKSYSASIEKPTYVKHIGSCTLDRLIVSDASSSAVVQILLTGKHLHHSWFYHGAEQCRTSAPCALPEPLMVISSLGTAQQSAYLTNSSSFSLCNMHIIWPVRTQDCARPPWPPPDPALKPAEPHHDPDSACGALRGAVSVTIEAPACTAHRRPVVRPSRDKFGLVGRRGGGGVGAACEVRKPGAFATRP